MIKPLEDIWSSISSNTKARVSDPFAGTFILSWVLCNWNHLALLFWGRVLFLKELTICISICRVLMSLHLILYLLFHFC